MTIIAIATPLPEHLEGELNALHPDVTVRYERDLLPPLLAPGHHTGDPAFVRTPEQEARFRALLADADVLYGIPGESATALREAVDANPRLTWVQTMTAGGGAQVVGAKLSAEQYQRVRFTTSAGVHGSSLAEFAIFSMLSSAKNLPGLLSDQANKRWPALRVPVGQLEGSTVLILGLGEIGKATAARAKAFGMQVLGSKRTPSAVDNVDEVIPILDVLSAVERADHIVITLPGTDSTKHLVNAEFLARVKPGVSITNVGRGTVIDEDALLAALDAGVVSFAGLDVFEVEPLSTASPLWNHPRVLTTPHSMALTAREDDKILELFRENLRRYLAGEEMLNVVNTEFGY